MSGIAAPDSISEWYEPLAGRASDAIAQATTAVAALQQTGAGEDLALGALRGLAGFARPTACWSDVQASAWEFKPG